MVVSDILKHRDLLRPSSFSSSLANVHLAAFVFLPCYVPAVESWPIFCYGGFGFPTPLVVEISPFFVLAVLIFLHHLLWRFRQSFVLAVLIFLGHLLWRTLASQVSSSCFGAIRQFT